MQQEMNLHPAPFDKIARGEKTVELRLNDEKRRLLKMGDTILFTCTDGRQLTARVAALHPFPDFAALYAALPLTCCGYTPEEAAKASPTDMEAYYTKEQIAAYGALGIELEEITLL